ncbi:MAG: peptide deformylase [Rectinema sp.]
MLDIVTFGDPVLEKKASAVERFDEELSTLIADMFESLKRERGLGLAAPQVGKSLRLFITDVEDDKPRVFINPEIVQTSPEEVDYEEGCLSFPGLYTNVRRPESVRIQAFGEKGRPFTIEADGLLARVILHENDHLDGKLFIDRLSPVRREKAILHYNRLLRM